MRLLVATSPPRDLSVQDRQTSEPSRGRDSQAPAHLLKLVAERSHVRDRAHAIKQSREEDELGW